ncbi:hypothetical protein [uncultured Bacteroides sp.]|uniref:hypothetical protein n=1 Tax=uncultured Bacteroides sp. TaxID=162156 RepID=UPI0025E8C596|nr:hypothetical protein [uncultured Bacteroides sp.]
MTNLKITTALLTVLLLLSSCSHKSETGTLFSHADALMEEYPDSALRLLDLLPEEIEELSDKKCARYALLLARATDKCKLSLLPCDSLLNVALDYYDDDEKEKAVALLYKGRLAVEIEKVKEAISYLQEGLTIIQNFPKELKTKNLLLSSLGNIYFDTGYYDKSIGIYKALYQCCTTELEKSIALNNISTYYCLIDEKDSTLMFQRKALNYAIASGDSLQIAMSKHNLSLEFDGFDELDSALYYAQKALIELPQKENHGNYYFNLGDLLLKTGGNKDSARYYLNKSLEDIPIEGKTSCLKSLYNLEKENGDYRTANTYLEEHSAIIDSLYYMEQSTEIQQLIYEYDTKMQVREEQIRGNRIVRNTIAGFVFVCLLIIIIYQNRINRKKQLQHQYEQSLKQTLNKLSSLEATIENNQLIIGLLQQERINLRQEHENKEQQIKEREQAISDLKKEKQKLLNWLFSQSSIYKKVITLSKQIVSDKKEMKVLTTAEQEQLKNTIFEIYNDNISFLHKNYPKLTESDLLFLCLQETSLEPLSIAICFGYSNTHPLNQKKYKIKERMNEEESKI